MSDYKENGQECDETKIVVIRDELTGTCVYAFCPGHQEEFVHPVYAFNLDFFRMARDEIIKIANEIGRIPHVALPHRFIENKVCISEKGLAEHLFGLEVADEEKP